MNVKKFSPYSKVRKSSHFHVAESICKKLQKNKFEAYYVGGCVRDLLLNPKQLPKDIDIATSASPEKILLLFPNSRYVGEAFGVCLVTVGEFSFEIATFRVDGEYQNKRHPKTVTQGSLFEDSCRRDFTMNALYYDPCKRVIIDFHGGQKDIKQKIIRCVGNAEVRFDEDALRILRAFRFSANLKFTLEEKTKKALIHFAAHIQFIAKERILLELSKVINFYFFVDLIQMNLKLSIFFLSEECFVKKVCKMKYFFPRVENLFFLFLAHLNLFYEIDNVKKLKEDLRLWPLTRKDNNLCQKYLDLFLFEELFYKNKTNLEQSQYFLFKHFLKIKKICPISYKIFLKNVFIIFRSKELFPFLKELKENDLNLSHSKIVPKIVHEIKTLQLPEYYIQDFIQYYHYKLFLNQNHLETKNFVKENLSFVEKMNKLVL